MPRLPLHSPLILLLCLTHLQSILAQYSAQYIGCANPSGLSFPFSPSNTNAAGCGTACRNARYAYSFQRTVSGAFSCSCARTEPISGSGGLTTASGGVTTCPQNSYLVRYVFSFLFPTHSNDNPTLAVLHISQWRRKFRVIPLKEKNKSLTPIGTDSKDIYVVSLLHV